jgi:hypothetical protein
MRTASFLAKTSAWDGYFQSVFSLLRQDLRNMKKTRNQIDEKTKPGIFSDPFIKVKKPTLACSFIKRTAHFRKLATSQ